MLELAYWEGLDGLELAHALEVPLNTAYSRLRRAKLALRERLQELAPDHVARVLEEPQRTASGATRGRAELPSR